MAKVDLKKELKELYNASAKEVSFIEVPEMNYIMIDGAGDPNTSQAFKDAVQVLFSVSYTLKFALKKSSQFDYSVMPLQGLWWADDMSDFNAYNKANWKWTLMIMQPEQVTEELFCSAAQEVKKKKGIIAVDGLRFERFAEGMSAQIMHLGPFDAEPPTIEKLHSEIIQKGYRNSGKHHEIYLSDFTRTAPEKLKTIIRQSIIKV